MAQANVARAMEGARRGYADITLEQSVDPIRDFFQRISVYYWYTLYYDKPLSFGILMGAPPALTPGITPRARPGGRIVYQAWVWIPKYAGRTSVKTSRTFPTESEAVEWHAEMLTPYRAWRAEADVEAVQVLAERNAARLRTAQERLGAAMAADAELALRLRTRSGTTPPALPGEVWLPIRGWEDHYQVSNLGRVWSQPRLTSPGGLLSPRAAGKGYRAVSLGGRNRVDYRKVHELVLTTFVGPRPDGLMCRHLNGDPADNVLTNLCWGTAKENAQDMVAHGRTGRSKTHCPHGHPYGEANTYWTSRGFRQCRECRKQSYLRHKAGRH